MQNCTTTEGAAACRCRLPPATQEAAKFNQCRGVYIEGCDISGAWDNAVDMVAVQYGHILGSRLHAAGWCAYHKGGSAYHLVAGNEIYDCGESGYAAGQGTGFEYMTPPWLLYEAYDIKVGGPFGCAFCILVFG